MAETVHRSLNRQRQKAAAHRWYERTGKPKTRQLKLQEVMDQIRNRVGEDQTADIARDVRWLYCHFFLVVWLPEDAKEHVVNLEFLAQHAPSLGCVHLTIYASQHVVQFFQQVCTKFVVQAKRIFKPDGQPAGRAGALRAGQAGRRNEALEAPEDDDPALDLIMDKWLTVEKQAETESSDGVPSYQSLRTF